MMNKTEAAYAAEVLEPLKMAGEILAYWFEEWKWRLKAKALWYTPDFVVMRKDGTLEVHEVKGHMEEDAWVKLKVFQALYPLTVLLIRKPARKGDPWDVRPVGDEPESSEAPVVKDRPAVKWPY
jgi:hypothetical protein